MSINGTIRVTGELAPSSINDIYAVIDSKYYRGGYKSVDTINDRNTITIDRRSIGMMVRVNVDDTYWILTTESNIESTTDLNWSEFIAGGSGIEIEFLDNSGVDYNNNNDKLLRTIYNSNLDGSLVTPDDVGGIEEGTSVDSLTGKTMVEIINDLLFPTKLPTYTIPQFNISHNLSTVYEVGRTILPLITAECIKNDASRFNKIEILKNNSIISSSTQLTVGNENNISDQFDYPDPNNPNYKYYHSYRDSLTIPSQINSNPSSTIYNINGTYESGLVKKNNKGVDDNRPYGIRNTNLPQSGSTYHSNNITINGYYPYYYGYTLGDENDGTNPPSLDDIVTLIEIGNYNSEFLYNGDTVRIFKNILSANGSLVLDYGKDNNMFVWFVIFDEYNIKTKWYISPLNNGTILENTDVFLPPIVKHIDSIDSYWSNINFNVYKPGKSTSGFTTVTISE